MAELTRSFADACHWLFGRTGGASEWSLGPTRSLLSAAGDPQHHLRFVHIGGTNGKGSTAAFVAAALRHAGVRTGLYTSPHLVTVRERILVDGTPISSEAFAMWVDQLGPTIEAEDASFFEATTAIALADFAARGAEIAVVEVGLGGRLDATNVVEPLAAAVTNIALEHTGYLGDPLERIAAEKAGIAKPGVPFVVGEEDPRIAELLAACARRAGARPLVVPATARYSGPLAVVGDHQRRNAAVADAVLDALPPAVRPSRACRRAAFASTIIPGRFDRRGKWILDVAHNPHGVQVLCTLLREAAPPRPLHVILAVLADKDWRAILDLITPVADVVWATHAPSAPSDRRWNLAEVSAHGGEAVRSEPDFDRVLHRAAAEAETVVVCGSFHTVGDAMARLPGFAPFG